MTVAWITLVGVLSNSRYNSLVVVTYAGFGFGGGDLTLCALMHCLIIGGLVGCFALTFATVVDVDELDVAFGASVSIGECPGGGCFQVISPDDRVY